MNEASLIEKVTRIATKATLEFIEKRNQERKKKLLRNTKLLLKHYRELVSHIEDFQTSKPPEIPDTMIDIEEEELAIESIRRSKERTFVIIQFINRMLETYRILCEQSGRPEQIRRYRIVMELYIEEPKRSIKEIADCHKIENRTIYRDINEAVKALSVLVFGVDGIK